MRVVLADHLDHDVEPACRQHDVVDRVDLLAGAWLLGLRVSLVTIRNAAVVAGAGGRKGRANPLRRSASRDATVPAAEM
jgi:hypothetical protein